MGGSAVISRGISAFMARDWDAARVAKDEYWADRIDRLGAEEALRVAEELRQHALAQLPGWPSDEDRQADGDAHARLSELMRRGDRARSP
jgi:hypothetical protein